VRLTKHKVELDGARYALHFLGALTYEDPKMAADRVKITPKKKMLKISIDREQVVRAKKTKAAKPLKGAAAKPAGTSSPAKTGAPAEAPNADQTQADADQTKAEIASAPAAERPADPASVTSTLAPEHATAVLKDALNKVFAEGLDQQMLATMPAFWQLYYAAAAAKSDYLPTNATMLRQSQVDRKARLLSNVEPGSNQYAQANGVAGVAIYRAVVEGDGTAGEIAVARPIGFGLDENAVDAIRKAKFEPAMKDGKPVPVLLDLSVQFRIFSDRTAAEKTEEAEKPEGAEKPAAPVLPGPYSVGHP
jgi:TonB family protein